MGQVLLTSSLNAAREGEGEERFVKLRFVGQSHVAEVVEWQSQCRNRMLSNTLEMYRRNLCSFHFVQTDQ